MMKENLLNVKENPWYNWTFPEKTQEVYCVKCRKRIKTREDKVSHAWGRLCKKCESKVDRWGTR